MPELRDQLQSTLGASYSVERELGGGGMSRVFAAEDKELGRPVVVKVLPPELAAGLNAERFRREIQLAARLQHPHIVPLLSAGSGAREAGGRGMLYYTMPLIEGESLRARLAREGRLPIRDAARVLRDLADALAYAHARGVVHRDIKPENVLLSGHHALVADFGVARAVTSATEEATLTAAGVALGTPAYMAPEQVAADPGVDHRADIYALGALGYEILTGRPPFVGSTPREVLAAHIAAPPDHVTRHRDSVPPELARLVMRCLEKSPEDRWQTAEELLAQLEALAAPSGEVAPAAAGPLRLWQRPAPMVWLAASIIAVVAGVAGALALSTRSQASAASPLRVLRAAQVTNTPGLEIDPALSPDGKLIAYAAGPLGDMKIYVRQLSGGRPVLLARDVPGDQRSPSWSPDGSRIAFRARRIGFTEMGLRRGGSPSIARGEAIYIVPALGGVAKRFVDAGEGIAMLNPVFSPDGRSVAYVENQTIYVRPIEGGDATKIAQGTDPHSLAWSPDGTRLAYVVDNRAFGYARTLAFGNIAPSSVWTVPAVGGRPILVSDTVSLNTSPVWGAGGRVLLYVSSRGGARDIYVQPLRRNGEAVGAPERLTTGLNPHSISLSRDESLLAYSAYAGSANVFRVDIPPRPPVSVTTAQPVTTENQIVEGVQASPDGKWLAFDSNRSGNQDIYRMPADGSSEPEQLTTDPAPDYMPSWSPDGSRIVFHAWRHGNRDIFLMSADGRSVRRLTDYPSHEMNADFAPDGRRIAFGSARSGYYEVHTLTEDAGGRWGSPRQLTNDSSGHFLPRWSPDGRLLVFWASPGRSFGNSRSELRLVSADGGPSWPVPVSLPVPALQPTMPEWSSDGKTIYFRTAGLQHEGSIWSVPVSGGRATLLVSFDAPSRPAGRHEFASDGKRFYFTIASRESDIWVLEVSSGRKE
jgi:Tol biopolymer transport system component/tRNA A-37 threonylcarbamoyl transferase component Bud32